MTVTVTGAEPEQPPEPENTPPTASIDAAQVVTARTGETVRLQGAGNDAKTASRHLTFAWSQVRGTPRISMTGADTATASFTIPDVTRRKDLTFRLTVTDEGGLSADAEITVTLIPPPTTPEITIELMHSNFRVVREGRTAEFEILATDTTWEGLPLTLEIAIDGDFGVTTGTPDSAAGGRLYRDRSRNRHGGRRRGRGQRPADGHGGEGPRVHGGVARLR